MDAAHLGEVDLSLLSCRRIVQAHGGLRLAPPSQTWKTFLRNHLAGTIAIDFLTVPTVTFNIVYVFFVLSLERRRVPDSPKARRQLAFVGIEHATCERRVFHPLRQRKAYIVECIHHVHA
jgi:hypothetical protein